ncbi:hypothetical protein T11_17994 [Trichinella zimbabwensis]|uniref:Integrase catalytic domain-containing protein n=1 Tax=Trichinella zimbabwensis TaxID=268475 RepID=A0A0V1H843_9BILA|nr:hypothetical protein T11_17994 [Trichinella zimbabwensis]
MSLSALACRTTFHALTYYKPIVQAMQRDTGNHNLREMRQFDYITFFTSDDRHINGAENAVADVLSRATSNCTERSWFCDVTHSKAKPALLHAAAVAPKSLHNVTCFVPPQQQSRIPTPGKTALRLVRDEQRRLAMGTKLSDLSTRESAQAHEDTPSEIFTPVRYRRRAVFVSDDTTALHSLAGSCTLNQQLGRKGRQFQSALWRQLTTALGIKLAPASAYHLQTNGMVEPLHRRLKTTLAAQANNPKRWIHSLPPDQRYVCRVFSSPNHCRRRFQPSVIIYRFFPDPFGRRYENRTVTEVVRTEATAELSARFRMKRCATPKLIYQQTITILCQDKTKTISLDRGKLAFSIVSADTPQIRNMQLSTLRKNPLNRRRVSFARTIEVIP